MILILSQEGFEPTTEEVAEWIRHLGGDCVRVNGGDVAGAVPLDMEIGGDAPLVRLCVGGREVHSRDVRVVWLWRWQNRKDSLAKALPGSEKLAGQLNAHMTGESNAVSRAFFSLFSHARWLNRPDDAALSKIHALHAAAQAGLEVPATLVTNRRSEIERFRERHGRVITKSIGEIGTFDVGSRVYGLYTARVTEDDTASLPETVFPSLLQELVEKEFEVRAFYLNGRVYSMAIFSQADQRTAVDLRHYDAQRPNRMVPYRLPLEVEEGLGRMMSSLGLSTGSADLIRTPDGRHVFLEVNPSGQFGMVSTPCNYHLPRILAEHLMAEDEDVAR
ncbi:MAG TPA: grasp-with-spasm system ATP-grasp peptide maturase [Longimicrobiaceae bacterium]|jgi:ATP-GRASP peptide maturase of grasp-with-spasm system|nr:grasp-with-spasm system ATP-grasp peptide maturase [Longimicrobiaceae bacterium]